jgi:hypothetical protein
MKTIIKKGKKKTRYVKQSMIALTLGEKSS